MGQYLVGDYILTKERRIGIIVDIWALNDIVTVFETYILSEGRKRNLFYGEIMPIENIDYIEEE